MNNKRVILALGWLSPSNEIKAINVARGINLTFPQRSGYRIHS
jgi:hypothetical protein